MRFVALCACFLFLLAPRALCAQAANAKPAAKPAAKQAGTKKPAASPQAAKPSRFGTEARQLSLLSRELKNEKEPGSAYRTLAAFATAHAKEELGARAALELGGFDYNGGRYEDARKWLDIAKRETLLGDYVLFWSAQVDRNLNNNAAALDQLETLRQEYPQSVIGDLGLQALAETAISLTEPQKALDALATAKDINTNPDLLFLRGQAHEQAGDKIAAAGDYLTVYDHYPLSASAEEAGQKAVFLASELGSAYPKPMTADMLERADILFQAHRWQDAEEAYGSVLSADGPDDEQAQVRAADCKVQLGADPSALASIQLQEPNTEAERDYYLLQAYWTLQDDTGIANALAKAQSAAPTSPWAERALFSAGNYYWVKLNRDKAATYYQQVVDKFPASDDAINAQWRVAWAAYMGHRDGADVLIQKFLRDHPQSSYTPDALYWLGRLAQQAKQNADARSYFEKLCQRFPNNYFAAHAQAQLHALGKGQEAWLPVLDGIRPLSPVSPVSTQEPAGAFARVQRATALETIADDDDALLELHAAYSATHAAPLQFAIARAATNAEHYGGAIVALRTIYPSLESRPLAEEPHEAWMLYFPLPYASQIRSDSRRARLDPMIVAGLIHQESAFEKDAHSTANAYGLMQLIPPTAKIYAHNLRVRYSEERLFDPAYNLRLGTIYLSDLLKSFRSVEAALAAYNAGEDRVTLWQTGQTYSELPEFVESIPFTQTREYVEIVTRNATFYHQLYGGKQ
ncbi:MAG TPA: transglycosylase SLT domain-containing protein [Candidatus Acidoferrales bacterium]|nr:transglycosylase SLT domain-containing protein [Candidatus Acidoferrales bacterium]